MKSATPKLTAQQLMFCREYITTKDLDGTTAALRAGYSKKTARFQASRLLTKVNVRLEIKRLMDERAKRVEISGDRVLERLYKLGFFDVRKFFDEKGNSREIPDLDDDTAPAVIGFDFVTLYEGTGDEKHAFGQLRKIRLANPKDSLELLGRHLGLFKDRLVIEKDEFEGRSAEELRYFAANGKWPDKPTRDGGTPQAGAGEKVGG